tara:strand:- start:448 stop:828 length:381 start_codon:yes stop_codon:yes gene_type:complete
MFKKIFAVFSKKDSLPSPLMNVEQAKEEEAKPLPDIIEVPWKECAAVKNYEDAITKTHNDLKEFLYSVKMKEIQAIKAIERLENASDDKMQAIKESYLGDKKEDYEFTVSSATGKPAFLKKKKTNK